MLGFEAEAPTKDVWFSSNAHEISTKKIAGIKLNSWFGCPYLEATTCGGLLKEGCQPQRSLGARQYEIMIVTFAEDQLFIVYLNTCANRRRLSEIEWRCFD